MGSVMPIDVPFAALGAALLGGVGLCLLGMWLMTEGLRLAAGAALRELLGRATHTRWRALATGVALTAVVQSSSALTVAAIGFVNAGLLTLGQVLWLLFGSNLGTTLTGWLVAVVGLQFKVELLALPMVGAGMLLRFSGGARRPGHLGLALAGFGVLLLGIGTLRDAFAGMASGLQLPSVDGSAGLVLHLLTGLLLTLLMQSSSTASALVLTAAQGGLLGLEAAAAVVIGANIGTTGTAVLAARGATAHARRVAAAHVAFNLLAAAVALLLLPWLPGVTQWIGGWVAGAPGVPLVLALFHTLFNLLGVLLMWPLSDALARFLGRRFGRADDDEGWPRYLDAATATVPSLGVEALSREVARYGAMALRAVRAAMPLTDGPAAAAAAPADAQATLADAQRALTHLRAAIDGFVVRLNGAAMARDTALRLAGVLRRVVYYANVVETLPAIAGSASIDPALDETLAAETAAMRREAAALLHLVDPQRSTPLPADTRARLARWDQRYRQNKARLLLAGALGAVPQPMMDRALRSHSGLRRAVQQAVKAALRARPIASQAASPAASPATEAAA